MLNDTKIIIGKLIIPKTVQTTIDYLHNKVGNTEWSGILFYKLTKGDINTLKDLEFTAGYIYPMDIGSHSYTEQDMNKVPELASDTIKAYNEFPEAIELSRGMVHTHHSMTTFFSGTDISELEDNAGLFNYYISLIVNFSKSYTCKIAIPMKTTSNKVNTFKNTEGKLTFFKETVEEEFIKVFDLEVVGESQEDVEWLNSRIKELKDRKLKSSFSDVDDYLHRFMGSNFKREDFKQEIPTKVKSYISPAKFITSLIYLTTEGNKNLYEALGALHSLKDEEADIYSEMLSEKIEEIHDTLWESDEELQLHCIEALAELMKNSARKNTKGYEVLTEILGMYAAL